MSGLTIDRNNLKNADAQDLTLRQNNALLALPQELLRHIVSMLTYTNSAVQAGANIVKFSRVCKYTQLLVGSFPLESKVQQVVGKAKLYYFILNDKKQLEKNYAEMEQNLESLLEEEDGARFFYRLAFANYQFKPSVENYQNIQTTRNDLAEILSEENKLAAEMGTIEDALERIEKELTELDFNAPAGATPPSVGSKS